VVHVGSSPRSTSEGVAGGLHTFSIQSRIKAPHDGYLVVCSALRDELLNIGIDPKKIYDVKNAVDIDRFHPKRTPTPFNPNDREQIKTFAANRFLLGFVGGIYPYKGLDDLADALECVNTTFGIVIAGEGPERKRLERRFGEDGLFLGPIANNQIPAFYKYIDGIVLPSHTEGLPRIVLEAQATATPVVATRVGGVPEVLDDQETGLLCAPRAPEDLATKLDQLADQTSLRDYLARNGRRAVETEFAWPRLYDRYERYLREVIARCAT